MSAYSQFQGSSRTGGGGLEGWRDPGDFLRELAARGGVRATLVSPWLRGLLASTPHILSGLYDIVKQDVSALSRTVFHGKHANSQVARLACGLLAHSSENPQTMSSPD